MTTREQLLQRLRDGVSGTADIIGVTPAECRYLLRLVDPPDSPPREQVRPCRWCPAPVVFVRDEAGKVQVLDQRAPVYRLLGDGQARRVGLEVAKVSHFATCSGLRSANNPTSRERMERELHADALREMGDERDPEDVP